MRLAGQTEDRFLHDLARCALVGRSRNFPGYHINTARTTAYEKADFPLRPHEQHSVNSFHYNHVWPFAVMLVDFIVQDAFTKSAGEIDFPSEFIEGYAYLKNRFHGHAPGRFYDRPGATLWLPRDLLACSNPELNWLAARGADGRSLHLALLNQSREEQQATVVFRPPQLRSAGARLVVHAGKAAMSARQHGVEVGVPAGGLTALTLEEVELAARPSRVAPARPRRPWTTDMAPIRAGSGRVMRLDVGRGPAWIYAYFQAAPPHMVGATLRWRAGDGPWQTLDDRRSPFEFTVDLPPGAERWEGEFTIHKPDSTTKRERVVLAR
jgi:hypothetical protein